MAAARSEAAQSVLETIPSTKLSPPRLARRVIAREALMAKLLEVRRLTCVVVQGPAGFGKTSTLAAWRQALLTLEFDVAWLTLSPEDNEPARFFSCLLASLGTVNSDVIRGSCELEGRDADESGDELLIITLVQDLSRWSRELVLVIDDLQHIDDERSLRMLRWLLEYAPANLHVALGSRTAVPMGVGLARLRAQGQAGELDLKDLRFSPEESERFLRGQLGNITRRDALALHELTHGWVAGLQLFAIDLKAKGGADYLAVQMRDASSFAMYFEREVLTHLAAQDLDLLMHCAVANRFCASLCATLMGQPQAVARMTSRLTHLDREDLFVSQVTSQDREAWYRIHPLLREVLLARLAQRAGTNLAGLHGAAWRWFGAHGHVDEAVRHAVLAGDAEAAADLVEGCAEDLMTRGDLPQLGSLVRRLPAEVVRSRLRLRLLMARLRMYSRNLSAAQADIVSMESDAQMLEGDQQHALTLLRAGLALQRDDTQAVLAIRAQLEAVPDEADWFALSRRNHVLAWYHMNRGDYELARQLLSDGEQKDVSPDRRLVGAAFRGMSYALEGRIADADSLLREVLKQSEHVPDVAIGCVAAGLLSDPMYEANELEAACALVEPRLDLLERVGIPDAVLRAFLALASSHWARGHRLEAMAVIERLEDYAQRHGLDRLLVHALVLRLTWQLKEGMLDPVDALLQRINALEDKHRHAPPGTHHEIPRVAQRANALVALHLNDFGTAARRMSTVLEGATGAKRWREVVRSHLYLAIAQLGNGQAREAQSHLLGALQIGHRLGLVRSLLDISPRIPQMLKDLLDRDPQDPVLVFYIRRILAAAAQTRSQQAVQPATGKPQGNLDIFSDREKEVLQLVAQALPNKKIARVLGVTPHTVKWHLRKIYLKLGVAERDQAVARLRDMTSGESPAGR